MSPGETALNRPLSTMPGIGPKRTAALEKLGLRMLGDLLLHLPRRYEDRRAVTPLAELKEGEIATIQAEVVSARNVRLHGRMSLAVLRLKDATGEIGATFFGRGFLANSTFAKGARGFFSGEVSQYKGLCLKNPEYELLTEEGDDPLHTGRIVPVYPLTEDLQQRLLRRLVWDALAESGPVPEVIPETLRGTHGFVPQREALGHLHFPASLDSAERARMQLAYQELLVLQVRLLRDRMHRRGEEPGNRHVINGPFLRALGHALPFQLTAAQEKVISEIFKDLVDARPMLRLIQGDVGSGKTIVAAHALAAAADGGYQSAMMAPTEILAEQHFRTLRDLLAPLNLRVELLSGSTGTAALRRSVATGDPHVVVGTHALFQEKVQFNNLGLIVVDEQHRFGVMQRERLRQKGSNPDILHMTATPIPRTLALTLYGGMDLSLLDELPPGRLPIKTARVPEGKVADLYRYLRDQSESGRQSYVVCPLIDISDTREMKSVLEHFADLESGPLAGVACGLLHGKLDAGEKDRVMGDFKEGRTKVLFSTTVIEVGLDVPAATIMVIEDAWQFGLTQLHQLRGRVGRGSEQSHCFLVGTPRTKEGRTRLDVLCRNNSGFDIAEEDLKLRGPGEFYGLRQAGLTDFKAADLLRDVRLLDQARRDAESILDRDPDLAHPEHQALAVLTGHQDAALA